MVRKKHAHGTRLRLLSLSLAGLLTLSVAACGTEGGPTNPPGGSQSLLTKAPIAPTVTAAPTPGGLTEQQIIGAYAAAIDALLPDKIPANVYISPYAGQGERLDEPKEDQPLPPDLIDRLPDLVGPADFQFEEFSKAIGPLDDGGQVLYGGVFITLGAIAGDDTSAGAIAVRGSAYRKVGLATGDRVRLAPDPSSKTGWRLLDTTQEWSDS